MAQAELGKPTRASQGCRPPTAYPRLDSKCKGKDCFLCSRYSGIMAYIHSLPTGSSQKITTVLAETSPAMEEDSGYYSSQVGSQQSISQT